MTKPTTIHFIMTGGTIDSFWDGTKDTAITRKESILPRYIKGLKLYDKLVFTEVCMKDSRSLNKTDLKKIKSAIESSKAKKIVITHGTYTMADTARYLQANLKRKDQTIIVTGSMVPIDGFTNSDGPFNLGFALSELRHLEPGIYITMNGQLFNPEEVAKNISGGRFFTIFNRQV